MARIRTIKPEFWCNEALSALPEATHLLAAALLNYADDCGYFNANPRLVEAACSPLREPSVRTHESLMSLHAIGYIRLGVGADGKRYGQIVKFTEHQRVGHPTPSRISIISITWYDSNDCLMNSHEDFMRPHESLSPDQGNKGTREMEQVNKGNGIRHPISKTQKNTQPEPEPSAKPSKRPNTLKRPDDVSEDTWMAFVALRKAKKAPFSGIALDRMRAEAGKAKITIDEAMQTCCLRGWTGFKAEWLTDDRGGGHRVNGNAAPSNSYVGLSQKDYGKTRMGGFLERVMSAEMKAKLNGGDK